MTSKNIFQEMRDMIGIQQPIEYFRKLTDVLQSLSEQVAKLSVDMERLKTNTALAIQWEPKVASNMLAEEIKKLREADKEMYAAEISLLQQAYAGYRITQEYADFCNFWQATLGYHPFLEYK